MIKFKLLVIYIIHIIITYYVTKRFGNYFFTPLTLLSFFINLLLIILISIIVIRNEQDFLKKEMKLIGVTYQVKIKVSILLS